MKTNLQAIEARSVDQEKASHVNALTLCFRDSDKERQYQEDPDIGKQIDDTSLMLSFINALKMSNTLQKKHSRYLDAIASVGLHRFLTDEHSTCKMVISYVMLFDM